MLKYGLALSFVVTVAFAVTCPPEGVYKTKSSSGCRDYIKCNFGKQTVESCSTFLKAYDPVNMKCDYCWRVNCSAPATPWPTQPPSTKSSDPATPSVAPTKSSDPVTPSVAPTKSSDPVTPSVAPTKSSDPVTPSVAPTKSSDPVTPSIAPIPKSSHPAVPPVAPSTKKSDSPAKPSAPVKIDNNLNGVTKNKDISTTPKPQTWWNKVKHFFGA